MTIWSPQFTLTPSPCIRAFVQNFNRFQILLSVITPDHDDAELRVIDVIGAELLSRRTLPDPRTRVARSSESQLRSVRPNFSFSVEQMRFGRNRNVILFSADEDEKGLIDETRTVPVSFDWKLQWKPVAVLPKLSRVERSILFVVAACYDSLVEVFISIGRSSS